jgi:multidrug efflux pump subunit AcrB
VKGALAWAIRNPVFANLLTVVLLVSGFFALNSLVRELFPDFSFDTVSVTVPYPGAAPAEIERSITTRIEEAVRGTSGVRKIESTSSEGVAQVRVEIDSGQVDPRDALVDIRNEVNSITRFPEEAEEPVTDLAMRRSEVATLAVKGNLAEDTLAVLVRELEDELLLLPEISEVNVAGVRVREIAVEVDEAALQSFGLSFDDVAQALRRQSLDLPLGLLRSDREEQLLRVEGLKDRGLDLEGLTIKSSTDGVRIRLDQVAKVVDGFGETKRLVRLDGQRAATIQLLRTNDQDTIKAVEAVKVWMAQKSATLPEGVTLQMWNNNARSVIERLGILTKNGGQGLALVFVVLIIFLGFRLSFWVAFGLPVAFLTAMILLLAAGGSLNMISSFALIMILGVLVDDSIVVAENIARHLREKGHTVQAAIDGLLEVAYPVMASVTTTIIAFIPLFFIGGTIGKFVAIMPVAVIACLIASLIECLLILPPHLAHAKPLAKGAGARKTKLQRLSAWFQDRMDRWIEHGYGRTVDWSLRNRYVTAACAVGFCLLVGGLVASGRPAFTFFPRLDSEYVQAVVTMPVGTSVEETRATLARLASSVEELNEAMPVAHDGGPIVREVLLEAGVSGANMGKVVIHLPRSDERPVGQIEVIREWKKLAGSFPEARSVAFGTGGHRPGGRPLEIRVLSRGRDGGVPAAEAIRDALATYPGVFSIEDNLSPGKRELRFTLRPEAEALGVTLADVARQLYAGFTGQEVYKVQRGRDELSVRVRYGASLGENSAQLSDVWIRLKGGRLVPLTQVAEVTRDRSLSKIERIGGRRVSTVFADIDDDVTNGNEVVRSLEEDVIPGLQARYPGTQFVFGGAQEEQKETIRTGAIGFALALVGIYAILSLLFGSYLQPLITMAAIPFGFGGAVLGHIAWGSPLTIFSLFGMIGLTGIVVNDSLVMIDFINAERRRGTSPLLAASRAGRIRFRAVFLTTVTTVAGLLPLLLEKSPTALFLIPMALSVAAGVAAATVITLYLVPCLYLIVDDVRAFYTRTHPRPAAPPAPAYRALPASAAASASSGSPTTLE